jgi:hypothetical protein
MKRFFYKDNSGVVYEYDDEEARNKYGKPELVRMTDAEIKAHLAPPLLTDADIDRARLIAYADPITGSDRFKIEAGAERLSGNERAAVAAEEKWLARRAEIAAELPWSEGK